MRIRAGATAAYVQCNQTRGRHGNEELVALRSEARQQAPVLVADVDLKLGLCMLFGASPDPEAAVVVFQDALHRARDAGNLYAEFSALNNLGYVRMKQERYDEAADVFEQALGRARALGVPIAIGRALTNLGLDLFRLGDHDLALAYLTQSEKTFRTGGFLNEAQNALNSIATVYSNRNEREQATLYYGKALALARQLGDKWIIARALGNLGRMVFDQGNHELAQKYIQEALDLVTREDRGRLQGGGFQSIPRLRVTLALIAQAEGQTAKAEALFKQILDDSTEELAVQWEAHLGLASLHHQTSRLQAEAADRAAAFEMLDRIRSGLKSPEAKISFLSTLRTSYHDYVVSLIDQQRAQDALVVADQSRARMLLERAGRREDVRPLAPGAFRSLAQAQEAVLLSYWVGPVSSFLWVITSKGVTLQKLPPEDTIRKAVEHYREAIVRASDPLKQDLPEGRWLFDTLVGEAAASIPAGATVIVVPDGPLHQLAFETLVVWKPTPHYWIEDVRVAVAPSLTLLGAGARPERCEKDLLAIGDPPAAGEAFPHLANAAREMQDVLGQFDPDRRVSYSGEQATPDSYRSAHPGRFAFIHFAAHASANRESPLDSAVVLSKGAESYKLYARDILDEPLHAQLVTLSACRGAGARDYWGEGLLGFSWAFLHAGARNVVASLWNVEDAAASETMARLYTELRTGRSPADALRTAKLALLHSGGAYRRPFYWAPFVIYTRDLREPQRPILPIRQAAR
jgi:CHAT domain-containing protein/Tfp pilus assembly protein PilF